MSNSDAPVPPAGWYPAPHANGEMRYWDGARWLEPQPVAQPAPLATAGAAATQPVPYAQQPAPGKKKGLRWWGWTLIGVGAVLVLIIGIGVANQKPSNLADDQKPATTTSSGPSQSPSEEASDPPSEEPSEPAAPTVQHQQFTGTGDMVETVDITGPAIVTFECGNCGGNTVLETNGAESLLVNEIGAYNGQHVINVYDGSVTTKLTITATGSWKLGIDDVSTAEKYSGVINGSGDHVFWMTGDFTQAALTNDGDSNFVIYAYGNDSNASPLIVNTIGAYRGTVPMSGPALVEIQSNGKWSITPQP